MSLKQIHCYYNRTLSIWIIYWQLSLDKIAAYLSLSSVMLFLENSCSKRSNHTSILSGQMELFPALSHIPFLSSPLLTMYFFAVVLWLVQTAVVLISQFCSSKIYFQNSWLPKMIKQRSTIQSMPLHSLYQVYKYETGNDFFRSIAEYI